MVSADAASLVVRDYTRVAQILISIGLRLLDGERKGNDDEPNRGLHTRLD